MRTGLSRADPDRRREARRQQMLLDALFAPAAPPLPADAAPGWDRGLRAYRANAAAHAADTLRAQHPVVVAMLGDAAFDALAALHWRDCPPRHGDLARFGSEFPNWLETREDLGAWPWLADCARLEQALWTVQFAPPASLDDTGLRRLVDGDPARLRLKLAPGTRLFESAWPVVTLRALHVAESPDLAAIAAALRGPGETAWIWREAFGARCVALDPPQSAWLRALYEAANLGVALDQAGDAIDLHTWLRQAVAAGWIDDVAPAAPDAAAPATSSDSEEMPS